MTSLSFRARRAWALAILFGLGLVALWFFLTQDKSIQSYPSASFRVRNGRAYDKAEFDVGRETVLVVPDSAKVERFPQQRVQLFMEKRLSFMGHPPEAITIGEQRKNMGCAKKAEGDKLVIATFGEWDSRKEVGAFLKLLVRVPETLTVEKRAGLSGPESEGRGWDCIPSGPDPELTAKLDGGP